ncbi:MAG: hypothetical protein ACFCVK_21160 [Acidimicrobiales bacterium]
MNNGLFRFARLTALEPGTSLFIHDFVRVDLPYDAVVGAFTHFVGPEIIGQLVTEAWRSELAEAGRALTPEEAPVPPASSVEVRFGAHRARRGALIIPITWHADADQWLPALQADLEVAAFGPDRTHLHVLGLSFLPPGSQPYTDRASLDHRLAVALVRHVLASLAELLVTPSPELSGARTTAKEPNRDIESLDPPGVAPPGRTGAS